MDEPTTTAGIARDGERGGTTASSALVAALPAILLACTVLLPFLGKPFTIDDPVFMLAARHASADPLHPTAFDVPWGSDVPERVSVSMPQGPVMAWLLVPAALSSAPEQAAHALELALLAVAILATVRLAAHFGLTRWSCSAAGLLVASTPVVLGLAATAMPDVPAMAFGVAGLERLEAWRARRRLDQAVLASVLLAVAALTRAHALLFVGVGLLLLAREGGIRGGLRSAWPLAGSVALFVLATVATRDPGAAGGNLAGAVARQQSLEAVAPNLLAFGVHWLVAVPLVLPWIAIRGRELLRWWWVFVAASAAGAAVLLVVPGPPASLLVAPLGALGAVTLVDVVVEAVRRDGLDLALASWLLLALPVVVYVHLPAKYLVASAPAAAILLARAAERLRPGRARLVLALPLLLGAVAGIAIVRADAAFAAFSRDVARAEIAPAVARGEPVWYVGRWGFQWYAEQAGARPVLATPPYPGEGDLIVSELASGPSGDVLVAVSRQRHLRRFESSAPGGRVMSKKDGAGFYSNSWGYLPWTWSANPVDTIDIWRVRPQGQAAQ